MEDEELIALNRMGFIPGPGEGEAEFLARVERTKKQFETGEWIPDCHWNWVREFLGEMFDVKPLYICAFYSNRDLAPWQGAASWIEGREVNRIQLREGLKKGSYLGIYRREEILAHEAIHAVRCGFDEDRCEEFFAYMTSEQKWRKVLGPILQRPWEAWPFMVSALGGILWPACYLGAAAWSGIGFIRLIRQHRKIKRAAKYIFDKLGDARKVRAVMFRLTDDEIERFSRGEQIDLYAQKQSCLRWRIIRTYL